MKLKERIYVIVGMVMGMVLSATVSYTVASTLINSKDVVYEDNSGLGANNVQAAIDGTCTKFSNELVNLKKEVIDQIYPVGSIFISTSNTNPSTLFGGTWEAYGKGQTLVGIDTSQSEFNTVGKTGGSKTVSTKLTEANLPKHTHDISHTHTTPQTSASYSLTANKSGNHTHKVTLYWAQENFGVNIPAATHYLTRTAGAWNADALENMNAFNNVIAEASGEHTHSISGTITVPTMTTNKITMTATEDNQKCANCNAVAFSTSTIQPYVTVYMWRRTK